MQVFRDVDQRNAKVRWTSSGCSPALILLSTLSTGAAPAAKIGWPNARPGSATTMGRAVAGEVMRHRPRIVRILDSL